MNSEQNQELEQKQEQNQENEPKQETQQNHNIDYNNKLENINKALSSINNNISRLRQQDLPVEEDNSIILSSVNNNNILVDKSNNKLSDYEIYKRALKQINVDKENNKEIPVHPKFIEYMEKYVNHVKAGGDAQEFKKEAIFKEIDISKLKFNKK